MNLAGPISPSLPNGANDMGRMPEGDLPMPRMLPTDKGANLLGGAKLKNTFLEFTDEEDPWLVRNDTRRQKTDSILDRSSRSLSSQLEQNIIETLQGHLALNGNASSSAPPIAQCAGLQRQQVEVQNPRPRTNFERPQARANVHEALLANFSDGFSLGWNDSGLTGGNGVGDFDDQEFYYEDTVDQIAFEAKFEAARIQQQHVLSAALAANGNPRQLHPGLMNPAMGSLMQRFQMSSDVPSNIMEAAFEEDEDALGEADALKAAVDPEVQARRDAAAEGRGLSGCTSIMIRHIPCKYTQRKLMREINSAGFLGRYDFFYLPMDPRSHANRGFAFLNFVNAEVGEDFYRMFHGQRLKHFNSEKVIAVMPADLQGFEQNAAHYAASRALRRKRAQHSKPLFFRPLPEHLIPDDSIEVHLDQPIYTGPMADKTTVGNYGSEPLRSAKALPLQNTACKNSKGITKKPQEVGTKSAGYGQAASKIPRFCAFCGHQRTAQHLFCPYCGAQFNE